MEETKRSRELLRTPRARRLAEVGFRIYGPAGTVGDEFALLIKSDNAKLRSALEEIIKYPETDERRPLQEIARRALSADKPKKAKRK